VKLAVLAILAFAALAFARPAGSEEVSGWQNAKWGMTPDEVQKVLSYPISAADLAKVCGEKCEEGAALQLDDYDFDGRHFLVRFWFAKSDTRLHTVSMYSKPGDGGFSNMKSYLQSIYGSPESVGMEREHFIVKWTLPLTTITLYSTAKDQLAIVYEEKSARASGESQPPPQ
jgi:hypothetical protein